MSNRVGKSVVVLMVTALVLIGSASARATWSHWEEWGYSPGGSLDIWVATNRASAEAYAWMVVDEGYARVETWVHGGTAGANYDQWPLTANAGIMDYNGPWCSIVTSKANYWQIIGTNWIQHELHFPSSVQTGNCGD